MVPTQEQLLNFLRKHNLPNLSKIAKHFNIQNTTVSDLVKDLEEKKLVSVVNVGGNKVVQVKENKMKKRGQVTTFVILGIIIIAVIGLTYYIINYGIKSEFEREQEKLASGSEFIPVKNYFDSCIKSVALDGAIILGSQGGYINIPKDDYPINPLLPFSNRLQIFNNDALEVPYWFYETSNGIQKTQIPSIDEMELQLENYVNANINECLINFTEFQDYEISGFDDVNTDVTIEDNKIFIEILTKITVEHKGLIQEFDKFLITLDVPLGKLYNKAKEILEKENNEYFFEQKTIDMLILYDEIPYSGLSFTCSPKIWNVENVKQDLRKIIKNNINAINPLTTKQYYKYGIKNDEGNINFRYEDNWPLFLEVDGGEKVLKESSVYGENNPAASFLRTLFCLNNYHFVYDIKYPILATLNENNFDFSYATMVIIDNNQPRENRLGINAPFEFDSSICESPSIEVTINSLNQETNSYIENSQVKINCVTTICDLGKTTQQGLKTKVPACANAVITASKEGYNDARITVDTLDKLDLFFYLKPKYKKQVEIKVISGNDLRDPLASEFVSFTLNNLDDETQTFLNQEINEIELSEGEYEVSSYIMREYPNGIKLVSRELEYCTELPKGGFLGVLGFTENRCTKTTIPESKLDQVLVGGAIFKFTLTADQLKNANKITFYTVFNKVPADLQELNDLYNLIQTNSNLNTFKNPTIR